FYSRTFRSALRFAGAMIDREKNPKVLGCVAGDDTVFAVLRDEESAKIMVEQLRQIASE
ncbi:MAG: ArgR family transcriptional regulator, partial [Clostridia bacterium]|nr:ArgR family transcriptional regulator [Clostridia bacterium]